MKAHLPLGIFDSGVGGLTVAREVHRQLPCESIVYLGDTARVPYGNKSREAVRRYALEDARFLSEQGVKLIVVACNTATAFALERLEEEMEVPVIGVIEPGVRAALEATQSGKIGIIGTYGTIGSRAYQDALARHNGDIEIIARPTPLLVPLVEENWLDHDVTRSVLAEYLEPILSQGADTLVLACTHYPLLLPLLEREYGDRIRLIDSASTCAAMVGEMLEAHDGKNPSSATSRIRLCLTDDPGQSRDLIERFLGDRASKPELVKVEKD
jgi:glutamate racemase